MTSKQTALTNLAKAPPADKVPNLVTQSQRAEAMDPDTYRHACQWALAAPVSTDVAADALLYVGRALLNHPDADAATVGAYAVRDARRADAAAQRSARADAIDAANGPLPIDDADLDLDDTAQPDADPASAFNYSPLALVTECEPDAVAALRDTATVGRALALTHAQSAVMPTSQWFAYGWQPGPKRKRGMTPQLPTPHSGPASAVVALKGDALTVDGLPWGEAAALLGIPHADPLTVAQAALSTITHPDPQTTTPLAEVKRETSEDKRAHAARQPIRKASPRKRPRSGRMGGPATIR